MNSLDIILYILGAGALFLLFTAGYALGHKDGKREGYTLGRSIGRTSTVGRYEFPVLDRIIQDEMRKAVAK
jgi:hypothetical protein